MIIYAKPNEFSFSSCSLYNWMMIFENISLLLSALYNLYLYYSGFDVHIYSVGKHKFCMYMCMYEWVFLHVHVCVHIIVEVRDLCQVFYLAVLHLIFWNNISDFPWKSLIQWGWLSIKVIFRELPVLTSRTMGLQPLC